MTIKKTSVKHLHGRFIAKNAEEVDIILVKQFPGARIDETNSLLVLACK